MRPVDPKAMNSGVPAMLIAKHHRAVPAHQAVESVFVTPVGKAAQQIHVGHLAGVVRARDSAEELEKRG
jgi:hypothetical protein